MTLDSSVIVVMRYDQKVRSDGFVLIRGKTLEEAITEWGWQPILDPIAHEQIDVIDTGVSAKPNGFLSRGRPPHDLGLHTDYPNMDTPPRYIALSASGTNRSVDTVVFRMVDFEKSKRATNLIRQLEEYICTIRLLSGRRSTCRILERQSDGIYLRYAWNCMSPLFAEARDVFEAVQTLDTAFPEFVERIQLGEGEIVIVDNARCLHGRRRSIVMEGSERDKISQTPRVVRRVLLPANSQFK